MPRLAPCRGSCSHQHGGLSLRPAPPSSQVSQRLIRKSHVGLRSCLGPGGRWGTAKPWQPSVSSQIFTRFSSQLAPKARRLPTPIPALPQRAQVFISTVKSKLPSLQPSQCSPPCAPRANPESHPPFSAKPLFQACIDHGISYNHVLPASAGWRGAQGGRVLAPFHSHR